jgi:hypothetical protein
MNNGVPAYGLWPLVVINSAILIAFAYSFFKPRNKQTYEGSGSTSFPRPP